MNDNLLSKKILSYDDVAIVPPGDSTEKLVDVTTYDKSITTRYIKKDMLSLTGDIIYVRDTIAKKLARVESALKELGFRLKIVYGYRHPSIQQKYFDDRRAALALQYPEAVGVDLDKHTHNFVAVPSIAGHPAGAAIDVTLLDINGGEADMGTAIADYSDEDMIKTFATGLSVEQVDSRQLLHDIMIKEGFAPFYGEWWHFSYGDREWAAFYNKKALYGAIDFQTN